jgi:serine/threonine protein kinase
MMVTKADVKLLDFGLAKLIDADGDATRTMECTVPGAVLGTVAYMSPEQAEGRPLDERSDVFSFGALLYEMLAGRRAFEGDTTARVTSAVLRDAPLALQTPPALDRIVRRCLAKEPSERFSAIPVQHAGAHATMIVRRDRTIASINGSKRATPIFRPSGRRDHDATRSVFHRCPRDGPRGRRSCSVPDPGVRGLRRHLVRQRDERGSRLVA